jgi:hypothetical protein
MKGARPARLLAEEILEVDGGVPKPFAAVMVALDKWLEQGRPAGDNQFSMPS